MHKGGMANKGQVKLKVGKHTKWESEARMAHEETLYNTKQEITKLIPKAMRLPD